MSQDWVIDVLMDIRQFAHQNRFPGLAEVLDDAIIVAADELRVRGVIDSVGRDYDGEAGSLHRGVEEHLHP
ncbi:MAG TPA: hypothetical protein VFR34_15145 [Paracoccaceae bacterium]|nr:hypothetical protein [Paracoccaceae bacterium]